jgi:hypothetical protein
MQFRYKTANPEERRLHLAELHAAKEKRAKYHLAASALRFIQEADYRRGCKWPNITQWAEVEPDLLRLTEAELKTGVDHIHIPRRVAKAYMSDDYIPLEPD